MHYSSVNARIKRGTKPFTLYKNVKIGSATSEFKKGIWGIFAATGPQFDDRRSFGTLAFPNGLAYHNFDFCGLIGTHLCTFRRNLARFGQVTPKFKT